MSKVIEQTKRKSLPVFQPVALWPTGPMNWGSFHQVGAGQLEIARRAGARVLEISFYEPPSLAVAKALFLDASCWFLPYGSVSQGALTYVSKLERWGKRLGLPARPPCVITTNGEGAKGCLFLSGHREVLRAHDRILVACEGERLLLQRGFEGPARIEVVPLPVVSDAAAGNGIFPLGSRARREIRSGLGLRPSDPLLLYAGRVSEQKNVHVLLDAFAEVRRARPDARLLIAGSADSLGFPHFGRAGISARAAGPSYSDRLAQQMARLRLSHAVRFLGPVSQERLGELFTACDLHLSLTTHYGEDFGYSIAQGLCAGAPTLVTEWGGGAEFVGGGAARGLPVRFGRTGPSVSAKTAAREILAALEPGRNSGLRRAALRYSKANLATGSAKVVSRWKKLLGSGASASGSGAPERLVLSRQALAFYRRQRAAWKNGQPLFKGPRDPGYRSVCRAYLS